MAWWPTVVELRQTIQTKPLSRLPTTECPSTSKHQSYFLRRGVKGGGRVMWYGNTGQGSKTEARMVGEGCFVNGRRQDANVQQCIWARLKTAWLKSSTVWILSLYFWTCFSWCTSWSSQSETWHTSFHCQLRFYLKLHLLCIIITRR
jgi:hypothetical protein